MRYSDIDILNDQYIYRYLISTSFLLNSVGLATLTLCQPLMLFIKPIALLYLHRFNSNRVLGRVL